jgi:hypothetical protein
MISCIFMILHLVFGHGYYVFPKYIDFIKIDQNDTFLIFNFSFPVGHVNLGFVLGVPNIHAYWGYQILRKMSILHISAQST